MGRGGERILKLFVPRDCIGRSRVGYKTEWSSFQGHLGGGKYLGGVRVTWGSLQKRYYIRLLRVQEGDSVAWISKGWCSEATGRSFHRKSMTKGRRAGQKCEVETLRYKNTRQKTQ